MGLYNNQLEREYTPTSWLSWVMIKDASVPVVNSSELANASAWQLPMTRVLSGMESFSLSKVNFGSVRSLSYINSITHSIPLASIVTIDASIQDSSEPPGLYRECLYIGCQLLSKRLLSW